MSAPTANATPIPLSGLVRACRLAEGGMGRVDLAIKRVGTFRRLYAVKRLHPHLATDPEFRQMFLDEARVAGLIRHPNVVGVLDVGEDELGPFLVMDYVDGLPLGNLLRLALRKDEAMPVQIAVRIALDVARGLHAAHELEIDGERIGLVHRDLSPQNVMVGFDGLARLTDFGIAKALGQGNRTATGVVKGKTSYLAPEQIAFEEPDRRSDLFSLGIVLYEMLSGERLYRRGAAPEDMRAILEEPAPDIGEARADVPPALVQLLFELLAKSRDARPESARDVADRLEAVLADLIQSETRAGVGEYVELIAGDSRKEQGRVIADAIAEAERKSATPASGSHLAASEPSELPARGRAARAVGLVLLSIGALALSGLGLAWISSRSEVAVPPAPSAPALEAPPVEPPAAEPAATVSAREGEPLAEDEPLDDPLEGALAPEDPETPVSPTERPRRRIRRSRRTGPETGSEPLPGWVEFDE